MKPPAQCAAGSVRIAAVATLGVVAACQHAIIDHSPSKNAVPVTRVESPGPPATDAQVPAPVIDAAPSQPVLPCIPEDTKPKLSHKRKPQSQPTVRTEPAPIAAQASVAGAVVKSTPTSLQSVLGKKVQAEDGGDLGRVVDVLSDSAGRVRIAVIEFGGFLGVGMRRIAVDWSLLSFRPDGEGGAVVLRANKQQLQETPDYRDPVHPQALMAPAAADRRQSPAVSDASTR